MEYRELGRTGWHVSTVSFGAWAIGGTWGDVQRRRVAGRPARGARSRRQLLRHGRRLRRRTQRTAARPIAARAPRAVLRCHEGRPAAQPARRRGLQPRQSHRVRRAQPARISKSTRSTCCSSTARRRRCTRCRKSSACSTTCKAAGKLRHYGVSVEKVDEALQAIEYPGVQTVQIIFNIFRQKPRDEFFAEAERRRVGILARLPLSSGMLSGKLTPTSTFAPDDHRSFNREGAAFDRGETFSGLDYGIGSGSRRTPPQARAAGHVAGAARPALDSHVPSRHLRDPRREARRTGRRERRRRRLAAAVARNDGGDSSASTTSWCEHTSTTSGDAPARRDSHSTVTLLARFRGLSTSQPRSTAMW